MSTAFYLRDAQPGDERTILTLIRGIAEYEHMLDQVENSEALIRTQIFEKKTAECIIACENDTPVGFALFFTNYSTFVGKPGLYLEDLFVMPEHRGKGYGKKLFTRLARLAVDRGYARMEWTCLDWNAPSIAFYQSMDARPMSEWTNWRLQGDTLIAAAAQYKEN